MQDQVTATRGVSATYLASTVDAGEMRRRMGMIARGDRKLVYVAPERLTFQASGRSYRAVLPVAVDEATASSEWGRLRPEYPRSAA
jgi:ATP-dependent DNA helicase RecQ